MAKKVKNFVLPNGEEIDISGANEDLSNLTEAGLNVIKNNSGSGLEVGDIGMALYVDETKGLRRYLNGQIVDINTNTQAFLNRLKEITTLHPSLLCTEEEWQTAKTLSAFGQVGKFVFNYSGDDIVSVRIPAIVNVQGLFDLQNLGMTVAESLPNIQGYVGRTFVASNISNGQALFLNSVKGVFNWDTTGTDDNTCDVMVDASIGNTTYQNGAHVQQEAIQYTYFIQIATGSETEANITNKFENTNPQTLLESKYSDKPLYNESWLLSNGQWNAKAVYPTVYEGLQVEYNTEIEVGTTVTLPSGVSYTKRGLSVKLSTEEYTDYDFRLNTTDETFRLPLLDGSEDIISDRYDDLVLLSSGSTYTAPANGWFSFRAHSQSANSNFQIYNEANGLFDIGWDGNVSGNEISAQLPFKKGQVARIYTSGAFQSDDWYQFRFVYAQGNGSLYYYVGDIDQNHGIVNVGRIGEQLASKVDSSSLIECQVIIDTYVNGTSGYRIWSDGYCEQWGSTSTINGSKNINFLKEFKDNSYYINGNRAIIATSLSGVYIFNFAKQQSYFVCTANVDSTMNWKASGYLAEGEY